MHAARTHEQVAEHMGVALADLMNTFLTMADDALSPYVQDRGYETELHIELVERETWTIDGMSPPPPWSDAEKQWAKDNKSSPYVLADQ